jgi:prephenate dehydrogenase
MLSNVAIVGVGLIGGSFGLALKRRKLAQHVMGAGRTRASLERALEIGAIDEIADDYREAVKRSSFVLLAPPVRAIPRILEETAPLVSRGTVVTDAGSTKKRIVDAAQRCWPAPVMFVGAHPIAGSEKSGVQHATPDLFEGRVTAITPTEGTSRQAVETVADTWRAVGAVTVEISPEKHDGILARTSHVPHVIAALLVSLVQGIDGEAARRLVGTGLRDSTRLAESSAEVWRDICLANHASIRDALGEFRKLLDRAIEHLDREDGERLEALLREALLYRKSLFGNARETDG